jgi:endonuclease/exonuclease/phosphatase family metal-dependent hydrolase
MPRSVNDIYPSFTGSYTDAIPASILCSIDPVLHRTRTDPEVSARISEFMVDYIFTQPPYMAREVRQQCGVSDHCAFIAEIEKTV